MTAYLASCKVLVGCAQQRRNDFCSSAATRLRFRAPHSSSICILTLANNALHHAMAYTARSPCSVVMDEILLQLGSPTDCIATATIGPRYTLGFSRCRIIFLLLMEGRDAVVVTGPAQGLFGGLFVLLVASMQRSLAIRRICHVSEFVRPQVDFQPLILRTEDAGTTAQLPFAHL
jgi:hypothetical protein